ncbi:MAG: hypothetical protein ACUZ8H_00915, partial [Candidatus Anammoxibacter sp.]
ALCIDYFHDDHQESFKRSGVNLFFVPAMSQNNKRLAHTARNLGGSNLSSSFISIKGFLPKGEDETIQEEEASFYYIPDTKKPHTFAAKDDFPLLIYNLSLPKLT